MRQRTARETPASSATVAANTRPAATAAPASRRDREMRGGGSREAISISRRLAQNIRNSAHKTRRTKRAGPALISYRSRAEIRPRTRKDINQSFVTEIIETQTESTDIL